MVIDPGLYRRATPTAQNLRPAVFLDRDGVIVEEVGYLHKVKDIAVIPSAPEAVARLNAAGIPVIVVTNQAGIGRGYYTWAEFEQVQLEIEARLRPGIVDGVWACGYHGEGGVGDFRKDHPWRKPHPGMLLDAAEVMGIDLSRSWLIGDKVLDIECAIQAGLAGAVLVRTGYGAEHAPRLASLPPSSCRITTEFDIGAAITHILPLIQAIVK
jgi:D-glycero-D-manno-heptose 1,7-bisphosphate phosphatase